MGIDANTQLTELRKWAEEVNAAYADGGYAAGDGPNPPDPDVILELVDALEAVRDWSLEEPDPDPKVDNPAMIGHFAGFQKARRVVQDLLGIGDPDVI